MKEKFTIKKEHLKLLQRMRVNYDDCCEFGAPIINPKRPYGNSDVHRDIIEIIGLKQITENTFEFDLFGKKYTIIGENKYNLELDCQKKLCNKLEDLHKETATVLQICLELKTFEEGDYEYVDYKWRKVNNE